MPSGYHIGPHHHGIPLKRNYRQGRAWCREPAPFAVSMPGEVALADFDRVPLLTGRVPAGGTQDLKAGSGGRQAIRPHLELSHIWKARSHVLDATAVFSELRPRHLVTLSALSFDENYVGKA